MKKIKQIIMTLFMLFFMFSSVSCNLEGLINGGMIPSGLISGIEIPSSNLSNTDLSSTEEQGEINNYIEEVMAQYNDLLNYYFFVEGELKNDPEKLDMINNVYSLVNELSVTLKGYSSLTKEDYDFFVNAINQYKDQIRSIYESNTNPIEECIISFFDSNYNLLYEEYHKYGITYYLPEYTADGIVGEYWVDMDNGEKYYVNTSIFVDRHYNLRQEVSIPTVDATNMNLEDVKNLNDGTIVTNLEVVITYIVRNYHFVADKDGNDFLIYGDLSGYYGVWEGNTIRVDATKTTYAGYAELSNVTNVYWTGNNFGYDITHVNEDNVYEVFTTENNYQRIFVEKAKLISIDTKGTSYVKIGDYELAIYKSSYLSEFYEGGYICFDGVINCYLDTIQVKTETIWHVQMECEVSFDFEGDGIIDLTQILTEGQEVSTGAIGEINGRKFLYWEEVQIDENGFEFCSIYSYDTTLYYYPRYEKVLLRPVYDSAPSNPSIWDDIPNSYNHKYSLWPNNINGDAGGDAFAVINDSTAKFHENGNWMYGLFNTSWKYMIVVDGQGKIAYAVSLPACGYGFPMDYSYYAHPDYANDYTTNPAFNILEGFGPWAPGDDSFTKFEIVVPKGGFVVTAHGKMANELVSYLSDYKITSFEDMALVNQLGVYNETYRLFFDEATQELRIYEVDDSKKEINGITVYNDQAKNIVTKEYTIAIDATGKVIYGSYGLGMGYGGPADGFYHDGTYQCVAGQQCGIFNIDEQFAGWPNVTPEGYNAWTLYEVVAPTGGYLFTGNLQEMTNFIYALTGYNVSKMAYNTLFESELSDGCLNDKVVTVVGNNIYVDGNLVENCVIPTEIMSINHNGLNYEQTFDAGSTENIFFEPISLNQGDSITFSIFVVSEALGHPLTYDNTSFIGAFTDRYDYREVEGKQLYHSLIDGWDSATHGIFYVSESGTYDFVYNSAYKTLTCYFTALGSEEITYSEPIYINGIKIYTSGYVQELDEFTIAVDNQGKIIYAGKTALGYGGPADGFYHDGSYYWKAGEHNGIYELDAKFQPWPATAMVNGTQVNAWSLYNVKVPAESVIITGSYENMKTLLTSIDSNFQEYSNYFEMIEDGSYNYTRTIVIDYTNNNIIVKDNNEEYEDKFRCSGPYDQYFEFNSETNLFEAKISVDQWWNVYFYYTDTNGNDILLTYDNTTFVGDITSSPDIFGAYNEAAGVLYIEEEFVETGRFVSSSSCTLFITYNPENSVLEVVNLSL